jgi:hypothetical protein
LNHGEVTLQIFPTGVAERPLLCPRRLEEELVVEAGQLAFDGDGEELGALYTFNAGENDPGLLARNAPGCCSGSRS